jgi:hypothetical protein
VIIIPQVSQVELGKAQKNIFANAMPVTVNNIPLVSNVAAQPVQEMLPPPPQQQHPPSQQPQSEMRDTTSNLNNSGNGSSSGNTHRNVRFEGNAGSSPAHITSTTAPPPAPVAVHSIVTTNQHSHTPPRSGRSRSPVLRHTEDGPSSGNRNDAERPSNRPLPMHSFLSSNGPSRVLTSSRGQSRRTSTLAPRTPFLLTDVQAKGSFLISQQSSASNDIVTKENEPNKPVFARGVLGAPISGLQSLAKREFPLSVATENMMAKRSKVQHDSNPTKKFTWR